MNFFYLTAVLKGLKIDEAVNRLQSIRKYSNEQFLAYHEENKWQMFSYHKQNNQFYRAKIKDFNVKEWSDIPVMQKRDLQVSLKTLLSNDFSLKNVYVNNTSGSTGKPFFFAKDVFCHSMTWGYIINRYEELGLEYGKSMQARFFGIPLGKKKYFKEKVKDYLSARVRFSVFDLSNQVLANFLKKFLTVKFEYIYGYTRSLVVFAEYLTQASIVLKDVCPSLRYCIVTSEVCSLDDKNILESGFGVKVIREYGAAELDVIAFEDINGNWILNEENLLVEILDDDGNPVKSGETGNVVVTSLHNKAMPFIRYNLGDIISVHSEKIGYLRRIKAMDGRSNDLAILPSGKKSPGFTFYYISKNILESGSLFKELAIRQLAIDHFLFEYVSDRTLTPEEEMRVKEIMDSYLEPGLRATFKRSEKIARTTSGKFKIFESLINK